MPRRIWLLALVVVLVAPACNRSTGPIPDSVKDRIDALLGRHEPTAGEIQGALGKQLQRAGTESEPFPSKETIRAFYAKRGDRLIWTDTQGKLGAEAASLVGVLKRAGDDGLDPRDYAVRRLESLEDEMRAKPKDARAAERIADFDLLATTALFRFASDLSTGRVHPGEVESDWHTKAPDVDLARTLAEAIDRHDLEGSLAALRPPHPGYARLREALAKLRGEASRGGWPTIPPGPKLTRGAVGPRVALLQRRLRGASGRNSAGGVSEAVPSSRFDRTLEGLVREFQRLHGIEPDGVAGGTTLDALNVPIEARIRQIELNLERWRWIPRTLGDPHVLVNIAGFDLELEHGDAPSWRTRVVAGKAFTPTPVFSDRIVAVVVNPHWNVPESIAVNEYLPELQKNRKALTKDDLHVYQGAGDKEREVDPQQIDWTKIDPDHFPYTFRQDPGEKNPLGRLKFDLTNGYHVYLHDTPAGGVFGRAARGQSHGCIRVEHAQDLAAKIADDDANEKITEALGQKEERRIELKTRVPVHILYWTAWADDAENLHFAPDLYGFDLPQLAALEKVSERSESGPIAHDNGAPKPYP